MGGMYGLMRTAPAVTPHRVAQLPVSVFMQIAGLHK